MTKPSGTCGAGFQNSIRGRGSIVIAFADVAKARTCPATAARRGPPVRDGMGDANKLRDSGAVSTADQRTWYVAYNGNAAARTLPALVSPRTASSAPRSPRPARSRRGRSSRKSRAAGQAPAMTDKRSTRRPQKDSGHPPNRARHRTRRAAGLLYKASWDGILASRHGRYGPDPHLGRGQLHHRNVPGPQRLPTSCTCRSTSAPRSGWRIVDPHSTVSAESGITGFHDGPPQDVCAVKVGSQTHVFVATGKAISRARLPWASPITRPARGPPGGATSLATSWPTSRSPTSVPPASTCGSTATAR